MAKSANRRAGFKQASLQNIALDSFEFGLEMETPRCDTAMWQTLDQFQTRWPAPAKADASGVWIKVFRSDKFSAALVSAINTFRPIGAIMARPHRFTVRLSENEISAISNFANQIHAIPSVAVRILLGKALAGGKERPYIKPEPTTPVGSP
jgi:hypothetical protein